MEVTLKFDASDAKSLTVLAALTAALTTTGGAVVGPTSRNGATRTSSTPAPAADSGNNSANADVTIEKVRAAVQAKSSTGKRDEVKELLTKFGAAKVTELKKEQYAEFLTEVEAL